ncbi:hypothetical protein N7462_005832 [Penicillium macrosclerotiorum]|uniref:uncharacterized protein n=1 Tax=Penicillium macrosclerotiorum TaxID=303699 RepID=UPI0025466BE1|nr:uncharacterized protein N7462_005832 [Penicillium macrosclerotiorum]KAJ5682667.1 hypothetical protein N7462_005832 [Penicillium macrosclerotiorum]
MASIYSLNHPSNPFWDYMASSLQDHPFFAPRGHHHPPPPPPFWGWGNHHHPHHHRRGPPPFGGWDEQAQHEDEAEVPRAAEQNTEATPGPSTPAENVKEAEKEASSSESESDKHPRRHGRCGKGKHHGRGPHGLGGEKGGKGRCGPGHHKGFPGHHGPGPYGHPGAGFFGPHGRGGRHGGRGGRGRHHRGPPPFGAGPGFPGFDFLRNIASQFDIQLNGPTPEGVDFVPSVDIFDAPASYFVHVSLPGAKKDDLSIDYDTDESVLRLAGVVYRPGMNEDLHQAMVMEERAREVGVFEREVRLGTHESPAAISVDEITAKLEDGVLIVTLPKIEAEPEPKKKVVVEDGNTMNEKDAMHVDERASVTLTPEGSDSEEEETKEYVKVPVQ